jgi:O-methyltransferase involved in polyketide biosynthesis
MEKLSGVSKTLFIPLVARIFASKKIPEYFYDPKALSLEGYLPDESVQKKSSEYSLLASVARYYNLDSMVKAFISKNAKCNLVYLGAGFETAYYRLNETKAIFYEIDLPEVINVRRDILGESPNEVLIAVDIFNLDWSKEIDQTNPTLLVVSGVFQYFKEDKILKFISDIKANFSNVELIFDATNKIGLKYANKYVQKTGNTESLMYFYVDDSLEFSKKIDSVLIEERVFFTDARKILAKKLKLYTRIAMKIVDAKKRAILLHLKLN